jgi:hypothetical protein
MATCRPTLFLLTVKEILLVHFIITNFRVAHKMLCTPRLRNLLTTSRLSCLGRKAALTTIFLSVRQSTISASILGTLPYVTPLEELHCL